MTAPTTRSRAARGAGGPGRPPIARAIVAVVGVVAWLGLIWIGVTLYAATPPRAGFDLELLVAAGRNVAAGRSPYDPALVAGSAPIAEGLFYSYPPVVAQIMAVVAWLPSPLALVAWAAAAVVGLAAVTVALARRFAPERSAASVAIPVVALAPLCFPFAIGLLFGNLDVFFPLLYGVILLAVAPGAALGTQRLGGISLAIASIAKLHPASLVAWFATRAVAERRGAAVRILAVTVVAGLVVVALSVAIGGLDRWREYASVVRAGSNADLVDARNAGPAAQAALLLGMNDAIARTLHLAVVAAVLAVTVGSARRIDDPVTALAVAAAASLATLPVTWYHYPSALMPFALVALLRVPDKEARAVVTRLVAGALVVAALAIAVLPLVWVAIGLVLLAVHRSDPIRERGATELPEPVGGGTGGTDAALATAASGRAAGPR
ncbi:MAG TPA: glycosyltransferase 87 family protein [Candidatus Limnocylindrales bacterium]|nr:glycosyltransferase 87 family protein [Candidatus Limnocylindrales bacterium]